MKSILLIGLGRFGRHIAIKLDELHHHVMAVDKEDTRVDADIVFDTALYLNNDTVENERDKMVITPYDTELFMSEYL